MENPSVLPLCAESWYQNLYWRHQRDKLAILYLSQTALRMRRLLGFHDILPIRSRVNFCGSSLLESYYWVGL